MDHENGRLEGTKVSGVTDSTNEKESGQMKGPVKVQLKAGETYYWCACGKSSKAPFCDGSHACTDFAPLAFKPDKDEEVEVCDTFFLCNCKKTTTPPYCDKTHKKFS